MPPVWRASTRTTQFEGADAWRIEPRRALTAVVNAVAWALIAATATAGLALSACGPAPRDPETIVMASGTDLESGNPLITIHSLSRQIQRHALFVTLVKFDSLLQPEPYFAREWSWDSTQRVLTMRLFNGLTWHDAVPTTAADVRFTFEAARDPAVGSPRAADLSTFDSTHIVDDSTVQLYFNAPQARVPNVLAELPLVPRHLLDTVPRTAWRQAAYSTSPVGNGPFRFVDRTPGRRWRFARNTAFPSALGGPPAARQIVVAVVDEAATKFAGLVSGDLDIAGVSPTMAHLVLADPTLTLMTPPALFSNVLVLNTTRAPFDDVRVRRALALSIDRMQLVKAAVAGYATPAGSAIPPGLLMSGHVPPPFDTLRADALFNEAGWKRAADGMRQRDGAPLRIELLTVGSGDMAIEQLVQADLAARGIAMRIRVAEQASFLSTLRAVEKSFDLAITGIPGDIGLGQLSAMFATAQRGGSLDYAGYHRLALDSALSDARVASPALATDAWARVDALLQSESPVVWLYHARGVQGLSRRLEHVTMDLRGELVTVARWTRATALPPAPAIAPAIAPAPRR